MKENDEYEIGENNINNKNSKNTNKEKTHSILDKLRILRDENSSNNLLQKTNIALIKSANDFEIEELIKKLTGTENNNNNIGIRKTMRIIKGKVKINNICLYDYNYFIFNKYSYLKKEVMKNSDIYVIICNIFDQNLEIYFSEFVEYLKKNIDFAKKKIVFILIRATNNFLINSSIS